VRCRHDRRDHKGEFGEKSKEFIRETGVLAPKVTWLYSPQSEEVEDGRMLGWNGLLVDDVIGEGWRVSGAGGGVL
jgi:hypothetical protein